MTTGLPPDVDEIIDHLAHWAAGYSSGLKWNEVAKLKADMMNVPKRWAPVTLEALRAKCLSAGLSAEDTGTIVDLLKKRKDGRRLVPQKSYSSYRFRQEPGKQLPDPSAAT
ncbi:hypothetical protein [Rhodococcoides fascians]|uniref:hypothetical protein n=1 Tax=Rhodococcoides fascians TaxID=1828 RepID=UPI00068F3B85|nr:hypothetical protein [Rhodococcus fascians]